MQASKVFNHVEQILSFELRGVAIRLYLPDHETDFVQRTIKNNGHFWELRALDEVSKYIPPNGVVVDAGGFIGNHAIYFAKICHALQVYSFEPQHRIAGIFARNVDLNNVGHSVVISQCALGSKPGTIRVRSKLEGTAAATSFEYSEIGNIDCIPIDSLNLSRVDFIKADVEGMEADVLLGARNIIRAFHPPIWVEVVDKESRQRLEGLLSDFGYKLHSWLSELDALFLAGAT